MPWLTTLLRRTVWLIVLGTAGGAAYSWWRGRAEPSSPAPEWPPLEPLATTPGAGGAVSALDALVDTPDARPSGNGDSNWVEPNDDGSCPLTHPIKANDNSGIFHVPGGQFYERTRPERCYSTADAAIADGYRQAKA